MLTVRTQLTSMTSTSCPAWARSNLLKGQPLNFMKSLEDQPDGDDTVMIGDDDVRWIGGGGNDRIWVGYETDLTQTATFSFGRPMAISS